MMLWIYHKNRQLKIFIILKNIDVHQWIEILVGWLNGHPLNNVIGMAMYVLK